MNIKEYCKHIKKEHIYDLYSNVIRDTKEYDRITREKMCFEILKHFQETDNFSSLITFDEYQALIDLSQNQYKKSQESIYSQLHQRLLVAFDYRVEKFVVLDEFLETLSYMVKQIDVHFLKRRKEQDEYIRAIIKAYGMLNIEQFKNCLKHYLPSQKNTFSLFVNTDYYLQYYDYDIFQYEGLILNKSFNYYFEEFQKAYSTFYDDIQEEYFIPKKTLITILHNNIDIHNPIIKKLIKKMSNLPDHLKEIIINRLVLFSHIQAEIDESFLPFRKIYTYDDNLLSLLKEVTSQIPCAMFQGFSEKQFLQRYPQFAVPETTARLSDEDAFLFFKLYFALLEYTNNTYHVEPSLKKIYRQTDFPLPLISNIRDYFFIYVDTIIDDFIDINPYNFSKDELIIICDFKYTVKDIFTIMKYDHQYAYLLGKHGIFAVRGLYSSIEEIVPRYALPYTVSTNLIPFKGDIVYDGIFEGVEIQLSHKMKKMLKDDFNKKTTYYAIATDY